jgi:hypothetical protein
MINIPAFRIPDYRNLWAGAAFNQQGMIGEQVVLGLLVYQFTHSTAWVGVMLAIYFRKRPGDPPYLKAPISAKVSA